MFFSFAFGLFLFKEVITIERYQSYNPDSIVRVEETLKVTNKKIFLRHIPKQGSVVIEGFIETDSLMPAQNQFSCQYALDSLYRDANRVLNFNVAHNGEMLTISYIAVGTVITADDMNEIKAHMENGAIHGTHYDLPTASESVKGGIMVGQNLFMDGDTLNAAAGGLSDVVLDTVPATQDGGLWYQVEDGVPIVYIRYRGNAWRIASKPGTQSGVYFAGVKTNYAAIPLGTLQGATTFTIELKIATTDTITSSPCLTLIGVNRLDSMEYQPDFCFGLNGGYLMTFYSIDAFSNPKTFTAQDCFIADGQVHCIAITSSSSGIKLYCDGSLVKSGDSSKPRINSKNPLYIGWEGWQSAAVCQFELFEARLWSNTRTPEEIFNGSAFANISGDENYLRAWYIPDGSDLMTDYSPNGFDAHIYGLTIGG